MVVPVLGKVNEMEHCLICKEIVEKRFEVKVSDSSVDSGVNGFLCRFCYNKFLDSFYDRGFFKIAKMVNWMKRKDPLRVI